MFFGFELIKHMLNNAVFVDKKSEAMNAVVLFAHKLLEEDKDLIVQLRELARLDNPWSDLARGDQALVKYI